ncbi:hypothetical protein SAMN02745157_4836 [Kaistia soli DSM 19436]|uniref:Uncharacterized protein n=1 Tax=Kaistia soli DSM 19436 TaxID=1122133 RepID=A0A1M5MNX3_9HYPH|nr:hypothetical protein [Kaistia soli]SHG78945.1 hypothetical protein SAMN02745157_4836 [Kaistia soli DSM 19436]
MNNFGPDVSSQRRADMDGGWTFDELSIVGATLIAGICLALLMLIPVVGPGQ